MSVRLHTKAVPAPAFIPVQTALLQGRRTFSDSPPLLLQRHSLNHHEPSTVPPIVHKALRSPGKPLDPGTRAFFEPRFGHDFSRVRVHSDERSAEAARAVNARAFTAGRDVVFGKGEYAPGTGEGQRLLAHELAHVVQQEGSGAVYSVSPQSFSIIMCNTAQKYMPQRIPINGIAQ